MRETMTLSIALGIALALGACVSNPTPHPANEDTAGGFGAGGGRSGDGARRGPGLGGLTDAGGAIVAEPPGLVDAGAEDAGDGADGEVDSGLSCLELVEGFRDALKQYQSCETALDCTLLYERVHPCDCTSALTVNAAHLGAAEVLFEQAELCLAELATNGQYQSDHVYDGCVVHVVADPPTILCESGYCGWEAEFELCDFGPYWPDAETSSGDVSEGSDGGDLGPELDGS